MRSLRRALLALGAAGFVAGAVPLALALADEGGHQRELIAVTGPLIGWAFIGTGIYAWLRRPDNRFGALMTAVGFSACLAFEVDSPPGEGTTVRAEIPCGRTGPTPATPGTP